MAHLALAQSIARPVASLTANDAVRITDRILRNGRNRPRALATTTNGDSIAVFADEDTVDHGNNVRASSIDARVMALESLIESAQAELARLDPKTIARRRVDTRLALLLAAVELPD
jgi:hypothetical protein